MKKLCEIGNLLIELEIKMLETLALYGSFVTLIVSILTLIFFQQGKVRTFGWSFVAVSEVYIIWGPILGVGPAMMANVLSIIILPLLILLLICHFALPIKLRF